MTACVNKKSKRVAAVVTASLVGALSIGAPAVALADTNVDMLVAPEENAFSRGEITLDGAKYNKTIKAWEATATADGSALNIKATQVTPLGGSVVNIKGDDYKVSFAKADGTAVDSIVEPGQYVVTVECLKGQYAGGKATAKLAVKAADLKGVTAYEVNSADLSDTADDSFTYTGKKLSVAFADNGGTKLDEGEDYTIKILKEGTDNVASAPSVDVLEHGNYVGYMTGMGQYAGETAEVHFSVDKFNFVDSTVEVDDVIASETAPKHPTIVYTGSKGSADYAELDPSLVDLKFGNAENSNSQLFDKIGRYWFDASVDSANSNIISKGVKTIKVDKVASYASFLYDGASLKDSYLVSEADNEVFDLDKLSASDGKNAVAGLQVTAVNAKGNVLHGGQLGLGTWTVTVKVDPSQNDYKFGGSKTFTVKVVLATVDADANVFVYYNDKAVTSVEKTYDGDPIKKSNFTVKAFKDDNTNVSDDVEFDLFDSNGKKVDGKGIVDAGTYTLKITSDKLELTGTTEITITVNKVDLSALKIQYLKDWFGSSYFPASSKGITWGSLGVRYNTNVADDDSTDAKDDKEGWDAVATLPTNFESDQYLTAELWDVKKEEWTKVNVAEVSKVEGKYRVTLKGNKELAKNYTFANDDNTTSVEFQVVDEGKRLVFRDVKPGDWYLNAVSDAKGLGYVAGVSGSKYYQPTAAIKRCDVIVILARMAGVDNSLNDMDEGTFNKEYSIYLDYNDVDESSYYARALAWATKVDIAHGSNGAFRPNDTITREEFAALLSNYAMLNGKDVSVDADKVLAEFPDGSSVSDWAANAVAWAADADIMGNGGKLNPGSDITRAEVAAMAVNFQPEKITKPVK